MSINRVTVHCYQHRRLNREREIWFHAGEGRHTRAMFEHTNFYKTLLVIVETPRLLTSDISEDVSHGSGL